MKLTYVALSLLVAGTLTSRAQDYNTLISDILANNSSIKSARSASEARVAEAVSSNNLADPEVEVEYQWGRHGIGDKFDVNVSQGFDWPGVYRARGKANSSIKEAEKWQVESDILEKSMEIKLLLIDIVGAKRRLACLEERSRLIDRFTEMSEKAAGKEITRLDYNKFRVESARIRGALSEVREELGVMSATLSELNGGQPVEAIIDRLSEYPAGAILPIDAYERGIAEHNPALRFRQAMIQSQAEQLKAEKLMRLPGLTVGYHHSWEAGDVFNGAVVGLTLPVFSTRGKVKGAKGLTEALAYDSEAESQRLRAEMVSLRQKAAELHSRWSVMASALGNGENEELLEKAYQGGELSFLELISELDYFLTARLDMLILEHDYQATLASLNKYIPAR